MIEFSIVIPLYNESENVKKLIEEIFYSLEKYDNFELILVDDGSIDKTKEVVNNLKSKFPIVTVYNKKNFGQSFSILKGIKKSKYKTIVTLDGDGQNNPKDIPMLLNEYFLHNDTFLVGGIRMNRKDNYIKIISSKIANNFRSFILNDGCIDTGCSLKVFDKEVFLTFPFFNGIHRFLPALYRGYGKKTLFIKVDHRSRIYGVSKYGIFIRLFIGIRDLIKVLLILRKFKKFHV